MTVNAGRPTLLACPQRAWSPFAERIRGEA
jgi:hypothetical protein